MDDRFRFLDEWTDLLPREGASVLAVSGSGGCTSFLLSVLRHLRREGRRVLWTQTTPHAVPFDLLPARCGPGEDEVRRRLDTEGVACVVGAPLERDRHAGLDVDAIEALRRATRPDVVLVEAHTSCTAPLRSGGEGPVWPRTTHLAVVVGSLAAVGRVADERSVHGPALAPEEGEEPRRIRTSDVLASVGTWLATVPPAARPLPFFTGFGPYRDVDGMFEVVLELWDPPRVPVVCLAELLGDDRREAADRAGLDADTAQGVPSGERVYAVYPASMDDD
jgi:hypothetical protein